MTRFAAYADFETETRLVVAVAHAGASDKIKIDVHHFPVVNAERAVAGLVAVVRKAGINVYLSKNSYLN